MDCAAVEDRFKKIRNPVDYFKGKGCLLFPTPEDILLFYRGGFDNMVGLGIHTDFHYRYVLIVNCGDPLKIFVDGTIVEVRQDHYFMILPFQYHRFINEGQCHISLLFMTFSMEDTVYFEGFRNSAFPYDQQTLDTIVAIHDCYFDKRKSLELPHLVGLLLAHVSELNNLTGSPVIEKAFTSSLVLEVCKAIYKDKSVNIRSLAENVGFSESFLRAQFKKAISISLGRFIIEIRLTEAMRLLARTEKQVSEIAELCGYDSVYAFSRSFKNHVGVSPSAYRRMLRAQPESQDRIRFPISTRDGKRQPALK